MVWGRVVCIWGCGEWVIWYEDGDVVNGWYDMGMWLMGDMV